MTDRLYQMNPQERFSDRAEDYAKYRPSYPSEAIDGILSGLGKEIIAADIGAGTGISSRLLADRGVKVIAIEPNAAMKQAATLHPLVEFKEGNAENSKLGSNSVDLVTCFQAFHWFNPEPTLKEFARILKPKGRLAAVWNNRDPERYAERNRSDEFTAEYTDLTKAISNHQSELRYGTEKFLRQTSLFSEVTQLTFPYQQSLDRKGLIGRAMSTSYIPKTGLLKEEFCDRLNQLYDEYCDRDGLVYLHYNTNVYLTSLLSDTNY